MSMLSLYEPHGADNLRIAPSISFLASLAIVASLLMSAGCDKTTNSGQTVGQKLDNAAQRTIGILADQQQQPVVTQDFPDIVQHRQVAPASLLRCAKIAPPAISTREQAR